MVFTWTQRRTRATLAHSTRSSAGKEPVRTNGDQHETLNFTQSNGAEVDATKVELTHCFSRRSDRIVGPGFDRSEATRERRRHRIPACLRLSSGTTSTRSSVRSRSFRKENPSEVKNPTSLQKKIGTRIVDRDAKALIAVTDAAALSSAGEPKLVDLVQDRQSSDDVIEQ